MNTATVSDLPSPSHAAALDGPGAEALVALHGGLDAEPLLEVMLREIFPGRIALVSSFGSESAVLLHMVARIDPATPVLFLDTGKHFPETIAYRDRLVAHLGLRDVRPVRPARRGLAREDQDGALWRNDPGRCCALRKVAPLQQALTGFEAWITGRKRYQGGLRTDLPAIESDRGRIKINPLAGWDAARLRDAFHARDLPDHPLRAEGYDSIGCAPCTAKALCGAAPRSGRWAGTGKTECGIHWPRRAAPIDRSPEVSRD